MKLLKIRTTAVYAGLLTLSAAMAVALPMSFEFRQLVSLAGVTVLECVFGTTLLCLLLSRPEAFFPRRYWGLCAALYLFLAWVLARALVGLMEGNALVSVLRGLRQYLPLLMLPALLYLLAKWNPGATRVLRSVTVVLVASYCAYASFLIAVVVSPPLAELFMMKPFLFRIGSSTVAVSMTLLLLAFLLWSEKQLSGWVVLTAIFSGGVTLLLGQSRFGTAMLVGLIGLAVSLYTLRTYGTKFLNIGFNMFLAVIVATSIGYLVLNSTVPNFDRFTELLFRRLERQEQHDLGVWALIRKYSLGTEALREPVIEAASTRPLIGFGEGHPVGETMSQKEGGYIDNVPVTMWYKNGAIGVLLYYGFWLSFPFRFFRYYLRYGGRLQVGISSILLASICTWLLWSAANIFLMYGWVLYPIVALLAVGLHVFEQEGRHVEDGGARGQPIAEPAHEFGGGSAD